MVRGDKLNSYKRTMNYTVISIFILLIPIIILVLIFFTPLRSLGFTYRMVINGYLITLFTYFFINFVYQKRLNKTSLDKASLDLKFYILAATSLFIVMLLSIREDYAASILMFLIKSIGVFLAYYLIKAVEQRREKLSKRYKFYKKQNLVTKDFNLKGNVIKRFIILFFAIFFGLLISIFAIVSLQLFLKQGESKAQEGEKTPVSLQLNNVSKTNFWGLKKNIKRGQSRMALT